MDILFEVLIEIFMELMLLLVPKERLTKKHRVIALISACIFSIAVLGIFFLGLVLIFECNDMIGFIPVVLAIAITAVQIGFGIRSYFKRKEYLGVINEK